MVEGHEEKEPSYSRIAVNYEKCTGCRICETVCSAYNYPQKINNENLAGLGNPNLTNIRVHNFNPDVDVPAVCAMCFDNPCIEACPVRPDPMTGRKALYRNPKTQAIQVDFQRCIGCGRCAETCKTKRVGIIIPNPETHKPEGMCTLCGGDPQCVKYCPFDALSHIKVDPKDEFYGLAPQKIAKKLIKRWYRLSDH